MAVQTGAALAAEVPEKTGLPQLDVSLFPTQIFWLILTFGTLYYGMTRKALPRLTDVIETRQMRIATSLGQAEALREQAAGILDAYEKSSADSVKQAQSVVAAASSEAAAVSFAREKEFVAAIDTRIKTSEAGIAAARAAALEHVRSVAAEAVQQSAARLAGVDVDLAEAEQAVAAVLRERR
jgi:F-type H+-transporting ATPase subunit b